MGAYACVSGTYNSANAANECSGACDDAQCCTPAWAATCGEQTEGQADAYACVSGTYNSANAANECSAGCDDATCCEEAPIAAFLCECGEADANDDTIIVWTNECTDGEAACDDTTDDEPVMESVASAVHVSAVVMMVFSFLWIICLTVMIIQDHLPRR